MEMVSIWSMKKKLLSYREIIESLMLWNTFRVILEVEHKS